MAKQYRNVVWEGRYQPLHRGHLAYMERLLKMGEHVWIWVVANEQSTEVFDDPAELPVPEFTREVDPHHVPAKNILPFWLRYRVVVETTRDVFGAHAPITVSGGRRLDLAWDLYQKLLPPNRVFLTPERDSYEDIKARAWNQLGERCVRIDVSDLPKVSATMIRERIANNESVSELIAPTTERLLREHGFIAALGRI